MKKTTILTCNECGAEFLSVKSRYCSAACRKIGANKIRIQTNIDRFGVVNPFMDERIKSEIKESNIKKYGVENPMQNKDINLRMHNKIKEKYGKAHALQVSKFKDKFHDTMCERYGGRTTLQSDLLNTEVRKTIKQKYGREIYSISHISEDSYSNLNNKEWLTEANLKYSVSEIKDILGVSQSVVNQKFRQFGIIPTKFLISALEREICDFIYTTNTKFEISCRGLLGGNKEIDIFIPSLKLGIECNGSYWHSEVGGNKDKNYHMSKTNAATENNIHLIHIWEHEWILKKEIIKSVLLSAMGLTNRLHARKTDVRHVPVCDERDFLNKNHLQGYVKSSVCIGLYIDDILVSLMSFGKNRFRHQGTELLRFCNIINTTVVGAANKLFKHYVKSYSPTNVISYCNREKYTGNMYSSLGFLCTGYTPPAEFYTKDYLNFYNRLRFQKHKLKDEIEIYDDKLTAWENMQNNGYDRIWNSGNTVWEWKTEK